jgi:hypothetical protein
MVAPKGNYGFKNIAFIDLIEFCLNNLKFVQTENVFYLIYGFSGGET